MECVASPRALLLSPARPQSPRPAAHTSPRAPPAAPAATSLHDNPCHERHKQRRGAPHDQEVLQALASVDRTDSGWRMGLLGGMQSFVRTVQTLCATHARKHACIRVSPWPREAPRLSERRSLLEAPFLLLQRDSPPVCPASRRARQLRHLSWLLCPVGRTALSPRSTKLINRYERGGNAV